MTIFYRLKVWAIKGWRGAKNAFKFVRPRTANMIWLLPVRAVCDYCQNTHDCVTLECDYEVVAKICGECLTKAQAVLGVAPAPQRVRTDHRGVIM